MVTISPVKKLYLFKNVDSLNIINHLKLDTLRKTLVFLKLKTPLKY